MPQLLPVFRAARLVGITRSALQKIIHDGELPTFEGQVALEDLLQAFPQTDLGYDAEYERIQNIKASAFAKRVRERMLPDAHVLARRVAELGRDLAVTQNGQHRQQQLLQEIRQRLNISRQNPTTKAIDDIMQWLDDALKAEASYSDAVENLHTQNTILRIMAAHIRIQPSNHEYWLEGNDTLLDAGVRSGLALNYGCTGGNCGLCKARVISGEVKKIQHHDYVLSEAEKNSGHILMCSCTAVTDVVLEALEATDENDIPQQEIITRVKSVDQSHPEILILHLQTPRSQRLRFLAGQSVKLSLTDGSNADFPIASCPCDDRNIIFHIAKNNPAAMVKTLVDNTRKGDEITVIGPHGHFLLQESSPRTPVFLAYGIGFAPIKSLIEHAMALETASDMHLYWAVENEAELYANNLCRSWDDALEEFSYHPVINADPIEQLLARHKNLADIDIYLAGPTTRTNDTEQKLLQKGLSKEQVFVENHEYEAT